MGYAPIGTFLPCISCFPTTRWGSTRSIGQSSSAKREDGRWRVFSQHENDTWKYLIYQGEKLKFLPGMMILGSLWWKLMDGCETVFEKTVRSDVRADEVGWHSHKMESKSDAQCSKNLPGKTGEIGCGAKIRRKPFTLDSGASSPYPAGLDALWMGNSVRFFKTLFWETYKSSPLEITLQMEKHLKFSNRSWEA